MRKEEKKTNWAKPRLIILTRGKPEERVLLACKIIGLVGPGYGSSDGCNGDDGACSISDPS